MRDNGCTREQSEQICRQSGGILAKLVETADVRDAQADVGKEYDEYAFHIGLIDKVCYNNVYLDFNKKSNTSTILTKMH